MPRSSYRPGRDRRIAPPGQIGGTLTGINGLSFEFRPNAIQINMTMWLVNAAGLLVAAPLVSTGSIELPTDGWRLLDATNPANSPAIGEVIAFADGHLEVALEDLPPDHVGTLIVPPWLPSMTDRNGRACGGGQWSIPEV